MPPKAGPKTARQQSRPRQSHVMYQHDGIFFHHEQSERKRPYLYTNLPSRQDPKIVEPLDTVLDIVHAHVSSCVKFYDKPNDGHDQVSDKIGDLKGHAAPGQGFFGCVAFFLRPYVIQNGHDDTKVNGVQCHGGLKGRFDDRFDEMVCVKQNGFPRILRKE
eukprot:scaffold1690_cov182-Amphora_coffeaeformis.AAC.33